MFHAQRDPQHTLKMSRIIPASRKEVFEAWTTAKSLKQWICQTAHFPGVSPETLYHAYLSSSEHSAMTADSRPALFSRHTVGEVARGQEGDELRAFGFTGPDGQAQFSLVARVLQLVPGKVIVLSWKNHAWNCALDQDEVTNLDSTVVLTFQ
jgi:uncharacterized protein YndB with AHSA1/START domain